MLKAVANNIIEVEKPSPRLPMSEDNPLRLTNEECLCLQDLILLYANSIARRKN
jgi:hypothetical protein